MVRPFELIPSNLFIILLSFYFYIVNTFYFYLTLIHEYIMKISQKIEQQQKDGKVWWSFEYFPPRTAQVCRVGVVDATVLIEGQGLQNLLDRIERMRALGPEFIDITWFVFPAVHDRG